MTTEVSNREDKHLQLAYAAGMCTVALDALSLIAAIVAVHDAITIKTLLVGAGMLVTSGFVGLAIALSNDDMGQWTNRLETAGYIAMIVLSMLTLSSVIGLAIAGFNGWAVWGAFSVGSGAMVYVFFNTGIWQPRS